MASPWSSISSHSRRLGAPSSVNFESGFFDLAHGSAQCLSDSFYVRSTDSTDLDYHLAHLGADMPQHNLGCEITNSKLGSILERCANSSIGANELRLPVLPEGPGHTLLKGVKCNRV